MFFKEQKTATVGGLMHEFPGHLFFFLLHPRKNQDDMNKNVLFNGNLHLLRVAFAHARDNCPTVLAVSHFFQLAVHVMMMMMMMMMMMWM